MGMTYTEAVGLVKQAGIYTDIARATVGNSAANVVGTGGLGGLAELGGIIHGLATDKPEKAKVDSNMNFIPGYGTSQLVQQRRNLSKEMGNERDQYTAASERFGGLTAGILPALILATAGGIYGYKKPMFLTGDDPNIDALSRNISASHGATLGAMGGLVAGPAIGSLLALIRRRRTAGEQQAYEQGGKLKNWLVPGAASYNKYKAYGYIHGQQNEAEQKAKEEKPKANGKDNKDKKPETKKD